MARVALLCLFLSLLCLNCCVTAFVRHRSLRSLSYRWPFQRQVEVSLNVSTLFSVNSNRISLNCSNILSKTKYSVCSWRRNVSNQWGKSVADLQNHPFQYLSIPIVAALVGYITNWLGVSMLFYPIEWRGIPIKRWPAQPFGLFGWQGVVPAKRIQMANTMVDVTINRLIKIKDVFSVLNPVTLASIMAPAIRSAVLKGLAPHPAIQFYLTKVARDLITNIEQVIDIKSLVVAGMTADPRTLGTFFKKVGSKELRFLVDSGTYFGFGLGLLQMIQWMLFPANWTLPISGAVVGYITNWIALKMIFEPLYPSKVGPFLLQGLFLRRQKEVSAEFCTYITDGVLNSKEVWRAILQGQGVQQLRALISRNIPFLSAADISNIVSKLKYELLVSPSSSAHPLHNYINNKLNLKWTLIKRMNLLTPVEFERVLHPIFEQDEIILIAAGGVLGMAAGFVQWWVNDSIEKRRRLKAAKIAVAASGD